MKKVLILTYHFPPEGGPAVQRISKFVKYLPEYNYQPIVLTTPHVSKYKDISLLNDISHQLTILRKRDLGQIIPGELRNKIFSKIIEPDKHSLWKLTAVKTAVQAIRSENIDLIFATSPPHSVQLIAQQTAQITKIPWIADFRDEWTNYPLFHKKKNKQRHLEMENLVLQNCDHLTTTTDTFKKNFSRSKPEEQITVIPNGYDLDDFSNLKRVSQNDNKNINITYCGRLNKLHSPVIFFNALSALIKNGKIHSTELTVDIVGNIENRKYLKNYSELGDIVKFYPYQPHVRCLELMAQSTALLLLATNMNQTEFLPAKVYEYFYLKKPIIALTSFRGELSKLLEQYGNVFIAYENEEGSMESAIVQFLTAPKKKLLTKPISETFLQKFNRKLQTKALSQVFDRLINEK